MSVDAKQAVTYSDPHHQSLVNGRSKLKQLRHVTRISCFLASFRKRSKSADPRNGTLTDPDLHLPNDLWTLKNKTKATFVTYPSEKKAPRSDIDVCTRASAERIRPLISTTDLVSQSQSYLRGRSRSQNRPSSFHPAVSNFTHSHTFYNIQSNNPWSFLRRCNNDHNGCAKANGRNSFMSTSLYHYPSTVKPYFAPSSTTRSGLSSSANGVRPPCPPSTLASFRVKNPTRSSAHSRRPVSDLLDHKRLISTGDSDDQRRPSVGPSIHTAPFVSARSSGAQQSRTTSKFDPMRAFRSVFGEPRPLKVKAVCKVTTCHRSPKLFPSTADHNVCDESHRAVIPRPTVVYPPRQDQHCAPSMKAMKSNPSFSCFSQADPESTVVCRSDNKASHCTGAVVSSRPTDSGPIASAAVISTAYAPQPLDADTVGIATSCFVTCTAGRTATRPQSTYVPPIHDRGSKSRQENESQLPTLLRNSWAAVTRQSPEFDFNKSSSDRPDFLETADPVRPTEAITCLALSCGTAGGRIWANPKNTTSSVVEPTTKPPISSCTSSQSPATLVSDSLTLSSVCAVSTRERSRLACPPILRPPRPPLRTTSLARDPTSSKYALTNRSEHPSESPMVTCPSLSAAADPADALVDSEVEQTVLHQDPMWWLHLLPYKPSNLPANLAERLRQRSSLMLSRSSPSTRLSNSSLPTGLPNLAATHTGQPNQHLMTQSLYEQRDLAVEMDEPNSPDSLKRHSRNVSVPGYGRSRRPTALRPSSLYTERMGNDPVLLPSLAHLISSSTSNDRPASETHGRVSRPSALAIGSVSSQAEIATPLATLTQTMDAPNHSLLTSLTEASTCPLPECLATLAHDAADSPLLGQYCRLLIMRTTDASTPVNIPATTCASNSPLPPI